MKTQEKMRKPLLEAKYLNVENTDRYRPIIRLFYLQSEKLKYWLYQEEHFGASGDQRTDAAGEESRVPGGYDGGVSL